jgi:hypothetical protein
MRRRSIWARAVPSAPGDAPVMATTFPRAVVPSPEVLVSQAHQKRDAAGAFTDEGTRKFLGKLLEELARWTARFAA